MLNVKIENSLALVGAATVGLFVGAILIFGWYEVALPRLFPVNAADQLHPVDPSFTAEAAPPAVQPDIMAIDTSQYEEVIVSGMVLKDRVGDTWQETFIPNERVAPPLDERRHRQSRTGVLVYLCDKGWGRKYCFEFVNVAQPATHRQAT